MVLLISGHMGFGCICCLFFIFLFNKMNIYIYIAALIYLRDGPVPSRVGGWLVGQ